MAEVTAGWVTQQDLEGLIAENQAHGFATAASAIAEIARDSAAEHPDWTAGLIVANQFLLKLAAGPSI